MRVIQGVPYTAGWEAVGEYIGPKLGRSVRVAAGPFVALWVSQLPYSADRRNAPRMRAGRATGGAKLDTVRAFAGRLAL
jgi:hypothetical protein